VLDNALMLCKCYRIVLYTVHVTAFLGGRFSGHGIYAVYLHCVSKKGPALKRYSSKLYGSILMIFGGNIQKSLE